MKDSEGAPNKTGKNHTLAEENQRGETDESSLEGNSMILVPCFRRLFLMFLPILHQITEAPEGGPPKMTIMVK